MKVQFPTDLIFNDKFGKNSIKQKNTKNNLS
jgi:hypothetical protein